MTNYLLRRNNDFNLFDNDLFFSGFDKQRNLMKTDIKELEKDFVLEIEVPGVKKENLKISLDNEYLTVSATIGNKEEKETKDKYLHRERFYGEYSRSYYVGNVKQETINAAFNDGVLTITFPKESPKDEEAKFIAIN